MLDGNLCHWLHRSEGFVGRFLVVSSKYRVLLLSFQINSDSRCIAGFHDHISSWAIGRPWCTLVNVLGEQPCTNGLHKLTPSFLKLMKQERLKQNKNIYIIPIISACIILLYCTLFSVSSYCRTSTYTLVLFLKGSVKYQFSYVVNVH